MRLIGRKEQFKSKVYEIALKEEKETGKPYQKCIDMAIDKAKVEMGVNNSEYNRMFR